MTENNRLKVYEQNNRISMTIWHCGGGIYVNFPQSFGRCQDWIGTQFCNLALILHILSVLAADLMKVKLFLPGYHVLGWTVIW